MDFEPWCTCSVAGLIQSVAIFLKGFMERTQEAKTPKGKMD
jgi:hypothetical protein